MTVYGIETLTNARALVSLHLNVATVLTVYGIETQSPLIEQLYSSFQLQQYLLFTVLKLRLDVVSSLLLLVATVLTVYGIETYLVKYSSISSLVLQQYLPFAVCNEGC